MEYDEIDQYVDQLFRQDDSSSGEETLFGDVINGDWRNDRIDQIIEDAYDEVIRWHNQRISEGSDPQSGLHGLPYIPWDERIDGVAAMQGAIGGMGENYPERNRRNRQQIQEPVIYYQEVRKRNLTCLELSVVAIIAMVLILYMMVTA